MTRRRLADLALVVAAALWLPGAGCLFDTRKAEEGEGGDSVWVPPTSPEIVVENLRAALEAGTFGDYLRAFTEDFTFEPDAADIAQLAIERPGEPVYDDWTRDVETETAESIAAGAESVTLSLSLISEQLVEGGRLQKYDYTLTLQRADGADVYQGEAWFEIRQEPTGDWLIHHWLDVITPETVESWGRLKGRSRLL